MGVSIAAPVGPIGALCIRKTLSEGRLSGLAAGFGAATADALYGAVAGFGLTAVSSWLIAGSRYFGLGGGAFLVYLGITTLLARPGAESAKCPTSSLWKTYFTTFGLTLTNPMTILSFIGIFAGLTAGAARDYSAAATLITGVFAGSGAWWLVLTSGIGLIRGQSTAKLLRWVNVASGGVILACGVKALATTFRFP